MRSKIIANNIANATTPNFKKSEVTFERELEKAVEGKGLRGARSNERHIPIGRKKVEEVKPYFHSPVDLTIPSGLNNVDVEHEMVKLAENQILYNGSVLFANGAYKKAIAASHLRSLPEY